MFEPRTVQRSEPARTRFRFQLTSLMDLLLIIVFAQFLEFRQASDTARRETLASLEVQERELADRYAGARRELDRLREQVREQNAALQAERDTALETASAASRERQLAIDALIDLLAASTAPPADDRSDAASRQRVASAGELARQLAAADSTEVLRFLVGYQELLKRAEVWTLHVSDRGDLSLSNGEQEVDFRLEAPTQRARTEEFVALARAASKQFPQPKGLVVILASYSPAAIAGNYQPLIDGLPRLTEILTADADRRTQFEAAVIGAIADPGRDLPTGSPAESPTQTGTEP